MQAGYFNHFKPFGGLFLISNIRKYSEDKLTGFAKERDSSESLSIKITFL